MGRKKILWLVSWYPNRNDKFDGDFIQRHARAAAIGDNVHVIFVAADNIQKPVEEEFQYATGLTEKRIYFRRRAGFLSKFQNQIQWNRLYKKAIVSYIEKNGFPDLVHVHVPWKAGIIALWMKKKYGTGFILTEHWGIYEKNNSDGFDRKPLVLQNFVKKTFEEAKYLITVSHFLSRVIQNAIGRKTDFIMPNVVDTSLFFVSEKKHLKFTFIHVSNMVGLKNVRDILDAFYDVLQKTERSIQLIMIGNRDEEYVQYAKSLGILNTAVFFLGEIPYVSVAEEMRSAHCFVLFSDSETFSCVTAEALCCGLPVISSNVGALPELINEGNGILVEHGDRLGLASSMIEIQEKYTGFNQRQIALEASGKYGYGPVSEQFQACYRINSTPD